MRVHANMTHLPEEREGLWRMAASPTMWAVHFLLSYVTAAIWCAKVAGPGSSLAAVRTAIVVYTLLALTGIVAMGWAGYRRHRLGGASLPHDDDTPEDRHRFLGFATLLLSALSAVAVVYAATVTIFIDRCF